MISLDYPPTVGGISAHVYELSKAIRKKGHEVTVVSREITGSDSEEIDDEGIKIFRIPLGHIGWLYGWKIQRFVSKLIQKITPDLIHIHGMRPLEFYDAQDTPLVYTNHTSGYLKRIKKGGYRISVLKRLFAKPDLFLAPSDELLEIPFGIRAPKIYIPNGIDFHKFSSNVQARKELRTLLGIKDDHKVAVITRRLVQKNGVKYLAEAMEFVQNKDFFLVVIGDGEERENIQNLLIQWIPGRFAMLGSMRHEEIIPYYSVADFSILPSLMEATSISGLEAMASGLPLVGTCVGGIPDLVDDGINGYLCEPASPISLANAIDKLLDCDIKAMGNASRGKAQYFDWSTIAEKTIKAYKGIL